MRRLLILLLVLTVLGALVAALGFVVSWTGGGGAFSGTRVLTLDLDGDLADYHAGSPLDLFAEHPSLDLFRIWRGLEAARHDPSVRALAVRIDDVGFGLAKAQEVRRQLAATAAAGKQVVCYFDTAGEGSNGTLEYYLATACPEISLSPAGEVNLLGLYADPPFLRGTLDKLKITPDFIAEGRYKSAPEMFTSEGHSPAAREELDAVLDSDFEQILGGIAKSRHLGEAEVRALVDLAPLSANAARVARLVDRIEYPDELHDRLEAGAGKSARWESVESYAGEHARSGSGRSRIALVFADGTILRGDGGVDGITGEHFIGSRDLGDTLAALTDDEGVAAVVLRLDSPGGSAVASDLLLRRVDLLRRKKPVVVSMSDLAASGGYYLAAKASRIVAEAGTLTGSIGVFSGKFALGDFERQLLGVTHDPLTRGANAGIYSSLRPFDDAERARLGARLDETYARFVDLVASGRSLPRPVVERIAQGRVWTGVDALHRHLVDIQGGLGEAVAEARRLAGLGADEGTIEVYPRSEGFWDWLAARQRTPFARVLAPLVELVRARRVPGTLELPPSLARLAHPF